MPKRGLGTNQKKCPQPASPEDCNDGDVIIENCDYGTAVSHVCVDGQWQAIKWVCPEAQSPEATMFEDELVLYGRLRLPHYGKFKNVQRKARKGRNTQTGAVIDIPAKIVVKFKAFEKLRSKTCGDNE